MPATTSRCEDCNDLSTISPQGFNPHLSVGQFGDGQAVEQAREQFSTGWEPIRFRVVDVCFISRVGFEGAFEVKYRIPFGGGRVVPGPGVPYLAPPRPARAPTAIAGSASRGRSKERPPAARFTGGRGENGRKPEETTVWNFAYGANMNSWKLTERRKIRPRESVAGTLPCHRLSFNHRGGMGNVVPSPGTDVHGVLLRVSAADFAKLQRMEDGYDAADVTVRSYDGRDIVAKVFVSKPSRLIVDGLAPPERYKRVRYMSIRRGLWLWPRKWHRGNSAVLCERLTSNALAGGICSCWSRARRSFSWIRRTRTGWPGLTACPAAAGASGTTVQRPPTTAPHTQRCPLTPRRAGQRATVVAAVVGAAVAVGVAAGVAAAAAVAVAVAAGVGEEVATDQRRAGESAGGLECREHGAVRGENKGFGPPLHSLPAAHTSLWLPFFSLPDGLLSKPGEELCQPTEPQSTLAPLGIPFQSKGRAPCRQISVVEDREATRYRPKGAAAALTHRHSFACKLQRGRRGRW